MSSIKAWFPWPCTAQKNQTACKSTFTKMKNQYLFFTLFTVICIASFQNLSSHKLIQGYFQALTWSHTKVESHEGFLTLIPKFKRKSRLGLTQLANIYLGKNIAFAPQLSKLWCSHRNFSTFFPILIVLGAHNLVTDALHVTLPVRTVLADLLIREDSLKSILKYLISSYFLLEM